MVVNLSRAWFNGFSYIFFNIKLNKHVVLLLKNMPSSPKYPQSIVIWVRIYMEFDLYLDFALKAIKEAIFLVWCSGYNGYIRFLPCLGLQTK